MFDEKSLLIYFTMIVTSCGFFFLAGRMNKIKFVRVLFLMLGIVGPAIIFAIRYNVGIDWNNYRMIYDDIQNPFTYYLEKGFTFLVYGCKLLGLNYYQFNFVVMIIIELCVIFSMLNFTHIKNVWIGQFVFFFLFYFVACNALRQMIACAFMLLAISFLLKGNMKIYMLNIFVAVLFHKTALLGVIFFVLYEFKLRIKFVFGKKLSKSIGVWIEIIIFSVFAVFLIPYIINFVSSRGMFASYRVAINMQSFGFLAYFIPEFIFLLLFMPKREEKDSISFLFEWFCLFCPLQALGIVVDVVDRLSLYPGAFRIILYPLILEKLDVKRKNMFILLTLIWYGVYFIVIYYILNANGIFPYKTIYDFRIFVGGI